MTTVLSTKGQVVLPRRMRTKLGLQPGTRFDIKTSGENVILTPRRTKRARAKLVIDKKSRMPTLIPPPGTPTFTSKQIREMLTDFP